MAKIIIDTYKGDDYDFTVYGGILEDSYTYSGYVWVQLAYEDTETNKDGYSLYYRCKYVVTQGNAVSSNIYGDQLYAEWFGNFNISTKGDYAVCDWVHYGEADYRVPYIGDTTNGGYTGNFYVGSFMVRIENGSTYANGVIVEWYNIPRPTFYLTYNCNGGIKGPDKVPYEWLGDEWTNLEYRTFVSSVTPIKNGYKLLGWSKDKNSTAPEYVYKANPDLYEHVPLEYKGTTLYAVWQERKDQKVYVDSKNVYARSYIEEDGLQTVEIDSSGNVYAAAFIQSDAVGILAGTLYAMEFIEGEPTE